MRMWITNVNERASRTNSCLAGCAFFDDNYRGVIDRWACQQLEAEGIAVMTWCSLLNPSEVTRVLPLKSNKPLLRKL